MKTYLVAFGMAFLVSFGLTPIIRRIAEMYQVFDLPMPHRKVHTRLIPRLGGIAIVIAFYLPLSGLFFYRNEISNLFLRDLDHVLGLYLGGIAIALLGVYDDLRSADHKKKFLVQFVVAVMMYVAGYRIHSVGNPFGGTIDFGVFSFPITLLWIVGVINAVNLIDGLDGLASGVAAITVATTFVTAFIHGNVLICLFCATLLGAILGFLRYNFNPASIFMGDSGSLFLGFILSIITIQGASYKGPATVAFLIPILSLGLPIMDTFFAMLRRYLKGTPIFRADRSHLHHRLLERGFTHRQAVLTLYGICLVFSLGALALIAATNKRALVVLLAEFGVVFLIVRWLAAGEIEQIIDRLRNPRSSREAIREKIFKIADLNRNLIRAENEEAFWESVKEIPGIFDGSGLEIKLPYRTFRWTREDSPHGKNDRKMRSVTFPLKVGSEELGSISFHYRREYEITADEQMILELFSQFVADGLERLDIRSRPPAGPAPSSAGRGSFSVTPITPLRKGGKKEGEDRQKVPSITPPPSRKAGRG